MKRVGGGKRVPRRLRGAVVVSEMLVDQIKKSCLVCIHIYSERIRLHIFYIFVTSDNPKIIGSHKI